MCVSVSVCVCTGRDAGRTREGGGGGGRQERVVSANSVPITAGGGAAIIIMIPPRGWPHNRASFGMARESGRNSWFLPRNRMFQVS